MSTKRLPPPAPVMPAMAYTGKPLVGRCVILPVDKPIPFREPKPAKKAPSVQFSHLWCERCQRWSRFTHKKAVYWCSRCAAGYRRLRGDGVAADEVRT